MEKRFNIDKIKNKKEKTAVLLEYLEDIKDVLAEVIDDYDAAGDDDAVDALTEALDALEDACDAIDEVLEG